MKKHAIIKSYAISQLNQISSILRIVDSTDYTRTLPEFYHATVGSHFRHSLNHYQYLFSQRPVIRYDIRDRTDEIAFEPKKALEVSENLIRSTELINDSSLSEQLSVEFVDASNESFQIETTFERELCFATHHAIHHLSTIKLMLTKMNYQLDDQIGIAPSTLIHNQNLDKQKEK